MLDHFVAAMAAHIAVNGGKEAIRRLFEYAARKRPDLEASAGTATTSGDVERIFREAVSVINAGAARGEFAANGAFRIAINGIKFDHQDGQVTIASSVVSTKVLVTGCRVGATGRTIVGGNTLLRSQGTSIEIGQGSSIVIKGGASIRQT